MMLDVPMGFEPNISLGCLTFSEYPTVHPMKLQGGALWRPINPGFNQSLKHQLG